MSRTVHLLGLAVFIAALTFAALKPTLVDSLASINEVLVNLPAR